jgi:hypothetical protein
VWIEGRGVFERKQGKEVSVGAGWKGKGGQGKAEEAERWENDRQKGKRALVEQRDEGGWDAPQLQTMHGRLHEFVIHDTIPSHFGYSPPSLRPLLPCPPPLILGGGT